MPKSPHPITIEDSVNLKFVNDAQISPDGKFVAFTVGDSFKIDMKHPKSQIWLADTVRQIANLSHRPFTTGSRTDNTPRWSPEGSTLAFLSDRIEDGKPQIHLIPLDGNEARAITKVQGNILNMQWSHDGKRIAFARFESARG